MTATAARSWSCGLSETVIQRGELAATYAPHSFPRAGPGLDGSVDPAARSARRQVTAESSLRPRANPRRRAPVTPVDTLRKAYGEAIELMGP